MAVLCTGDELLRGFVRDANAHYLASEFRELGLALTSIRLCSDDLADIDRELRALSDLGVDLIVTSGGLGPTHDDRTSEAVAAFTGRPLRLDADALAAVEHRVAALAAARGNDPARFVEGNRKQATLPDGSIALSPAGTAPGFVVSRDGDSGEGPVVVVLPGPPSELSHGWEQAKVSVPVQRIIDRVGDTHERLVRVWGIPESFLAEALARQGHTDSDGVRVTLCARDGELELSVRGSDPAAIDGLVSVVVDEVGERVFALDNELPIEALTGELLRERGLTLAVAESCTGGLLGARCTSVSGASDWFVGGVVSYANSVKVAVLGVDERAIDRDGAVSELVACQMAAGARERLGADVGVGITGVAGPSGGTTQKPVGTVWIGISHDGATTGTRVQLVGDRETIRRRSSVIALHMVRRAIIGRENLANA